MWVPILLNTFVHIVMYYYYLLVIFGYKPWWKMHLTDLQLVQFVLGKLIIHILDLIFFYFWLKEYYLKIQIGKSCSGNFEFGILACFVIFTFLILFTRLRMKNARLEKELKKE
jgi:fatty acid elongase 3